MEELDKRVSSLRELIALALEYAQKRVSSHTEYLHGSGELAGAKELISLEENALYSQLLMRSQVAQNILKARKLIERLLDFQVRDGANKGCFPRYLHQFPSPGPWRWQKRFFGYLAFQRLILAKECGLELCRVVDKALVDLARAIELSAPALHSDVEQAIFELMQQQLQPQKKRAEQGSSASDDETIFATSWLRWGPEKVGRWLAWLAAFDAQKFERASAMARAFWPPCCNRWGGLERRSNCQILSRPGIVELALAAQSGQNWQDWQRDHHLLMAGLITPGFKFLQALSFYTWKSHLQALDDRGQKRRVLIGSTPDFSIQVLQGQTDQLRHSGTFDLARFLWRSKARTCCARLHLAPCHAQLIEYSFEGDLGADLRFTFDFDQIDPKGELPLTLMCAKSRGDTWGVDSQRTTVFTDGQELVYTDEMVNLTLSIRTCGEATSWIGRVAPALTKQLAVIDHWRVLMCPLEIRDGLRVEMSLSLKKNPLTN